MQPGPSLLQAVTGQCRQPRAVRSVGAVSRFQAHDCRYDRERGDQEESAGETTRSPTRPGKLMRCGSLSSQIRVRVSRKPSRPPKRSKEAETAQTSALDEDEDKEDADEVDENNHQGAGQLVEVQ